MFWTGDPSHGVQPTGHPPRGVCALLRNKALNSVSASAPQHACRRSGRQPEPPTGGDGRHTKPGRVEREHPITPPSAGHQRRIDQHRNGDDDQHPDPCRDQRATIKDRRGDGAMRRRSKKPLSMSRTALKPRPRPLKPEPMQQAKASTIDGPIGREARDLGDRKVRTTERDRLEHRHRHRRENADGRRKMLRSPRRASPRDERSRAPPRAGRLCPPGSRARPSSRRQS